MGEEERGKRNKWEKRKEEEEEEARHSTLDLQSIVYCSTKQFQGFNARLDGDSMYVCMYVCMYGLRWDAMGWGMMGQIEMG